MHTRRALRGRTALGVLILVGFAAGSALAQVSPPTVTGTLPPGGSTTTTRTVSLPAGGTSALDLCLCST